MITKKGVEAMVQKAVNELKKENIDVRSELDSMQTARRLNELAAIAESEY